MELGRWNIPSRLDEISGLHTDIPFTMFESLLVLANGKNYDAVSSSILQTEFHWGYFSAIRADNVDDDRSDDEDDADENTDTKSGW